MNEERISAPADRKNEIHEAPAGKQPHAHDPIALMKEGRGLTVGNQPAAHLPELSLSGGGSTHHWYNGVLNVAKDVAKGAYDEAIHHPGELAKDFAIGAAVGAGAALVGPELAAVAGAGYLAYKVGENGGITKTAKDLWNGATTLAHDTAVEYNPEQHSQQERLKAQHDLESVGNFGIQTVAGVAGGMAGGYAASTIRSSLSDSGSGGMKGEGKTGDGASADAKAAADKAAAERLQTQSVADNQKFFAAANENGDLMTTQKQLYQVRFTKVTQPGTVSTLEHPAGEPVAPGQWIAQRLDSSGNPVMEKGQLNQWPVTDKTILKTYQATPEQLAANDSITAATKVDGPPVHMMKITDQMVDPATGKFTIHTPWGPMSGKAGDYLANYDYDAATGQAGKSYAIITKTSWDQTYKLAETPGSQAAIDTSVPPTQPLRNQDFPSATGADLEFAQKLEKDAAAHHYGSSALYAVDHLQDANAIKQFASLYAKSYPDVAADNIRFSIKYGRIEPGTEAAWQAALDQIKP